MVRGKTVYLIDTMWVIGPIGLIVLVVLIKRINKENKRLQQEYDEANGITTPEHVRGGQQEQFEFGPNELILVNATKPGFICLAKQGVNYVRNKGLIRHVVKRFGHLAKDGVIVITKSALCQLILNPHPAL